MRAMSKAELAQAAGVSRHTFRRWLKTDEKYLQEQGVSPSARVFPPQVVNYIIDKYCIEV